MACLGLVYLGVACLGVAYLGVACLGVACLGEACLGVGLPGRGLPSSITALFFIIILVCKGHAWIWYDYTHSIFLLFIAWNGSFLSGCKYTFLLKISI